MSRSLRVLLLPVALTLTSCDYLLDKDFHTVVAPSSVTINGELASLKVLDAPLDERTGDAINRIVITDYLIKQWYIGLDDAVIQSGVFAGNRQLALTVSIRRVSTPILALSGAATVEAFYQIIDQTSGATIYAKSIEAEGPVSFDYSPIGFVRGNEAINRGVQNNIKAFVTDLEKSLAAKPTVVAPVPVPHV